MASKRKREKRKDANEGEAVSETFSFLFSYSCCPGIAKRKEGFEGLNSVNTVQQP